MRVIFSDRAFAAVLAETTEKITTETGGLFLGVVQEDTWYIIEAIDPGPKSVFEVAYFEYDQKYTEHLINKIANLYNHKLDLIGLWHRHPGSFDQFSSTDDGTNSKYASMRKEGAISGLVNIDSQFRFTMYHVAPPCRYRKIPYEVGNDLIPDELLAYKTPAKFYSLMEKRSRPSARQSGNSTYKRTVSLDSFMRFIMPYIGEYECSDVETNISVVDSTVPEKLAEAIIEDLTFMAEKVGIQVTAEIQEQYLVISQEAVDKTTRLYFMDSVSKKQVVFSYNDKCFLYHSGMFEKAACKAKAEKDKQVALADAEQRSRRQGSVFDSVIKIIKFNRSEEENNGDKNS